MVKLKKPVLCEVDENYFVSAADFRSYAHCMMYPDPVGIVMSGKLNDIVTGAVNDAKLTIKEAFDKLVKRNAHGFIDYIVYGKRLASKSENTVEFVENTIVSRNKQELEVVASGMEAMGLSVETGYYDPDDESSVDVPKQLVSFHYVVLKEKV